jgi:hypothetical protein
LHFLHIFNRRSSRLNLLLREELLVRLALVEEALGGAGLGARLAHPRLGQEVEERIGSVFLCNDSLEAFTILCHPSGALYDG